MPSDITVRKSVNLARNEDGPIDVIVVTPEELQRDQDRIGTLIRPALKEGRVLYERAA